MSFRDVRQLAGELLHAAAVRLQAQAREQLVEELALPLCVNCVQGLTHTCTGRTK